ncbi:MAG: TonB family protein [Spirochaetota bacterium]|nr:TonB family protein [Spirochaetota bacterium]
MEKNSEIRFSLTLLLSLFFHIVLIISVLLPAYDRFYLNQQFKKTFPSGRDIIVNVNQDDQRAISRKTLLSDRDSYAKGSVTKDKGSHWLNNSLDFLVKRGGDRSEETSKTSAEKKIKTGILVTDNTELIITLMQRELSYPRKKLGKGGKSEFTKIPDINDFDRKNAIFYSNDGRFSFNTKKFKNFKYFKSMKDKIASNWYPPLLANSIISGYDPMTGSYTPGRLRIMAILNQMVKIYFSMNRDGEVIDVVLVESMGNRSLDSSCMDAIRLSENFGKVPKNIKGKIIVIPFVFGYFVY